MNNAVNCALSDANELGNLADAHIWLLGNTNENVGVVREESPGRFTGVVFNH
jgi:hypothetical protein